MLHQCYLIVRAKHKFIKDVQKNLNIDDSDDEKNLRKYKQKYGKNLSLTVPEMLIKKQKTAKEDKPRKSIKFE